MKQKSLLGMFFALVLAVGGLFMATPALAHGGGDGDEDRFEVRREVRVEVRDEDEDFDEDENRFEIRREVRIEDEDEDEDEDENRLRVRNEIRIDADHAADFFHLNKMFNLGVFSFKEFTSLHPFMFH